MPRAARSPRSSAASRPGALVRRHVPSGARRAQILHAAAELFGEHGFAGTTTREIAAAVGASETVLFRLFPTKESLYLAVLEHQVPLAEVEEWLRQLREIAETRDDEALFRAVVTAVLASYRAHPTYHRLMLFAALEHQELARVWQVKYTAPVTGFLREYVSRRQAEGAFAGVRPELVVHMLVSMASHFGLWNVLGVNPLGLTEREIGVQAVALLNGLRAGQ
ncbi:Rut operon repressor [Luteitalea pratensis]|uniref:Rut operon repressor n=1 Tax=Luteitalea pratensis TaxID=1855912 RepID=A0A143PWC2_LUTPR|nr:Rut operon repressor [Luteitalea pratensis]